MEKSILMKEDDLIVNDAYKVLSLINEELSRNNILNINYLLFNISDLLSKDLSISKDELEEVILEEINRLLVKYSITYKEIVDNPYHSDVFLFINMYFKKVLKYYDSLMIKTKDKFDTYVSYEEDDLPSPKKLKATNAYMSIEEIQNTMHLLNEAVRKYYEIFHRKTLIATFTDQSIINFKIKECELAHLLGINLRKVVTNPSYVDIFKITQKEIDCILDRTMDPLSEVPMILLQKIVDISDGNLLQFEEDRLKKIEDYDYRFVNYKSERDTLRNYAKINFRSKAFINFSPLEELSLALNFPEGYEIMRQRKKNVEAGKEKPAIHSILLSKNNLSEQFKYSSLIANYDRDENRRYFMSLFIKKPEQFEQWQEDAISSSITTSVLLENDDGGGSILKVFSQEEQKAFLREIQSDFEKLNLKELVDYFDEMEKKYIHKPKKNI